MITEREEFAGKTTNGESKLPNGKTMTRDYIIRMAGEAGFADGVVDIVGFEGFANFAALVAAHEREECAKVCEAGVVQTNNWDASDYNKACEIRAAAIRARGEK
jgi:hypothetical protein